jgi:prophage maintenance system killer protein
MKRFLAENGYRLRTASDEIVDLMLRIEDKALGVEQTVDWLRQRTISP